MDQDAFRSLLDSAKTTAPSSTKAPKQSSTNAKRSKSQTTNGTTPGQTSFQPRKVLKKTATNDYRDRAKERQAGLNEFADVEALLEDFEKRAEGGLDDPDVLQEQRKYLGGDARYTVLVKGLDYALLEQNKARVAQGANNSIDDALEDAFYSSSSSRPPPLDPATTSTSESKKRVREQGRLEIGTIEGQSMDKLKAAGKFRPIGASSLREPRPKRKEDERPKKKKRQAKTIVERISQEALVNTIGLPFVQPLKLAESTIPADDTSTTAGERAIPSPDHSLSPLPMAPSFQHTLSQNNPPKPLYDEDLDIFADVGEYEGMGFDTDEDDIDATKGSPLIPGADAHEKQASTPPQTVNWFNEKDTSLVPPTNLSHSSRQLSGHTVVQEPVEPHSTRLVPLGSSKIVSIRDVLAADKALEAEEKRKAKKEKLKRAAGKS